MRLAAIAAAGMLAVGAAACGGGSSTPAVPANLPAEQVFQQVCATCHGLRGTGLGAVPSIVGSVRKLGVDASRTVIANGRNTMPAFATRLTAAQIDALVALVATFDG